MKVNQSQGRKRGSLCLHEIEQNFKIKFFCFYEFLLGFLAVRPIENEMQHFDSFSMIEA